MIIIKINISSEIDTYTSQRNQIKCSLTFEFLLFIILYCICGCMNKIKEVHLLVSIL